MNNLTIVKSFSVVGVEKIHTATKLTQNDPLNSDEEL